MMDVGAGGAMYTNQKPESSGYTNQKLRLTSQLKLYSFHVSACSVSLVTSLVLALFQVKAAISRRLI